MKELNIGSLGGIHYEMYEPDPLSLHTDKILRQMENGALFLDLNSVFWSNILSESNVDEVVEAYVISSNEISSKPPYAMAISVNPDMFKKRIHEAKEGICEQGNSEREYFGNLETLAIFCRIYTELYSAYTELTIHEGFLMETYSSMTLYNDCLIPTRNPYYNFLKENVWSVLLEEQPECVWINGRITIADMAIARYLKKYLPHTKIFWAMSGSEYYATNKIEEYLQDNIPLFLAIDGIVLEDYEDTRRHILYAMENGIELSEVCNLMYVTREADGKIQIHKPVYKKYNDTDVIKVEKRVKREGYKKYRIAPWEIVNVKLFPQKICSWNRCTFCGINKKYRVAGRETGLEAKIKELLKLEKEGCKYFWLVDEEISAGDMGKFAKAIIQSEINMKWQARARIAKGFRDEELCKLLAEAGLKEIRFGLESASYRILKLMNKCDEDFSLDLVEQIVECCSKYGIHVHFPVIIGFPTETETERNQTYSFLLYLRQKYENVTFNVNILGLDVSSELFRNWQKFGISRIAFPCNPKYFLGNLVKWDCEEVPFLEEELEEERDEFMRAELYPWMPESSFISPHIFYRLMETIRNTMLTENGYTNNDMVREVNKLIWNPQTVVWENGCYNWESHTSASGNWMLEKIKKMFETGMTMEAAIAQMQKLEPGRKTEDLRDRIEQFINMGFLIIS